MSKEVKYLPITELLTEIIDNRGKSVPTVDVGFPLIATNCIKYSSIYPTFDKVRYVSENTLKSWFRAHIKPNDILFVNKGTPGRVCLVPNPVTFCAAQDMMAFRCDPEKINYKYLFAILRSKEIQKKIENNHVGLVIPHFRKQELSSLLIPIKGRKEQESIGELYITLSEKIELNNRINAELEAMAKTLYDYWFVQFDFPDKNGKPYKTSGGKMVWNEELKREIPEGWEVERLANVIDTIIDNRGKTPLKFGGDWAIDKDGVIALSAKHVKDGKLLKLEEANVVTFEMFERWMPNKLQEGDILMTSEAPCGEFYLILNDTNYCLSQRLFAIRANKEKVLATYLYFELSRGNGFSQIIGKQSGSTVFGIRQDELRSVNILRPIIDLQKEYNERVSSMLFQIRNNELQNQELSELRDWLLPMLMNGQVKVKDEKETELSMAAEPKMKYGK
jgi:type I restriction enzyme S subunit